VTNYVMFESGQPLHAFDYDVLQQRAGGGTPTIITRRPLPGEKLTTLDGVERTLDEQTILVCDEAGVLSLGGIMGGAESEIGDSTRNVLLEAASWDYINIRRTMTAQKISTEAGLRFSRGVHPQQAARAVRRAAALIYELGGERAEIARGVIDEYPAPAPSVEIALPLSEVTRIVGLELDAATVSGILERLQFRVQAEGDTLRVTVPDHRVDISGGAVGIADLCEEIARVYGYDRIPDTLIEDMLPPQTGNESLLREERVRDILAQAGLREVINYRLTTPEAEARLLPPGETATVESLYSDGADYVRLANPISLERTVLRHTLLDGVLQNLADNRRSAPRMRLYEIGSVFLLQPGAPLPAEPRRLAIALSGARAVPGWQDDAAARKAAQSETLGFFDLKGVLETLTTALRLPGGAAALTFKAEAHPTFHPGRCAAIYLRGARIGVVGEVHPLVRDAYDLTAPVAAAEIDLDALIGELPLIDRIRPILTTPAVYQDIAVVVNETVSAAQLEVAIRAAGGELLRDVQLFDLYQGDQVPDGQKSLAYALTFQAADRTLTDKEVARLQAQIVRALDAQFGATLRA
jgi:phenylalanyl-tRNA synthetase beta chain